MLNANRITRPIRYQINESFTVDYAGEVVGEFVADHVKAHEVQLVNDSVATQKDVGLVFDSAKKQEVEIKRKLRSLTDSQDFNLVHPVAADVIIVELKSMRRIRCIR